MGLFQVPFYPASDPAARTEALKTAERQAGRGEPAGFRPGEIQSPEGNEGLKTEAWGTYPFIDGPAGYVPLRRVP